MVTKRRVDARDEEREDAEEGGVGVGSEGGGAVH
jgi:hypothetical protein